MTASAPGLGPRALLVYCSRPGETYCYGGRQYLAVGNTQIVAERITSLVRVDVHRLEAADPYPAGYDATVERNVLEQQSEARPAIAGAVPSTAGYTTVLVGCPIWNLRPPCLMGTFLKAVDLTGATILPFTTHAMSGLGTVEEEYAAWCPGATVREGLAVRGEQAAGSRDAVQAWLRRNGLVA